MRTILLYRLMIILITPSEGNKENKIRDLNHFKTWFKHSLKINKGLGGVIKPDFTGFHHKTFYGAAYVPHALHNAALVQYLLDGTSFALDEVSKDHLRNALAVMRMVSVKYSTPNSISGRFPRYSRAILAEHFPAYAYISYVHPKGDQPEGLDRPEMFLRLFDPNNPKVKGYLKNGVRRSWIYYWNTIGSLDVINKVATLKCKNDQTCQAEKSPAGHWSKNFASLSIHRRGDWSVAARGFGKYTWDFEGKGDVNIYGAFLSHGTLQISNSEDALKSYDVYNGWDWTRIPGATTVATNDMDLDQIKTKARNYNFQGFAGGVSFIGSSGGAKPKQGAFGMFFKTPRYVKVGKKSPLKNLEEFRKSYFFYDHLIVCLGSDIKVKKTSNSDTIYAQTTLFQDKMLDQKSGIKIAGNNHSLDIHNKTFLNSRKQPVELQDTHGNTYQVQLTGDNLLHVHISTQHSKKSDGVTKTKGRYATAWLEHTKKTAIKRSETEMFGSNLKNIIIGKALEEEDVHEEVSSEDETNEEDPDNKDDNIDDDINNISEYEYAILIKGGKKELLSNYRVLRQHTNVHAIELNGLFSNTQDKVYGYSIFNSLKNYTPMTSGPIKSADAPCMIMAEKRSKGLKLAISYHDFEFEYDSKYKNKTTCTRPTRKQIREVFHPRGFSNVGVQTMFCVQGKGKTINMKLNHNVVNITKLTEMTAVKTLLTVLVLGIIVKSHADPDPTRTDFEWNPSEDTESEETDYTEESDGEVDELLPELLPVGPSERAKSRKSSLALNFDFEKNEHINSFTTTHSTRSISSDVYKNGGNSLLWKWDAVNGANKPKLLLTLRSVNFRGRKEMNNGGIKFWMYRKNKAPNSKMQIIFHGASKQRRRRNSIASSPTDVNLNFKGWRGVWIGYREFYGNDFQLKKVKKVEFVIKSPKADKLYIDLFQFSRSMGVQTRDLVVSKIGQTGPGNNDALFHDDKDFWQQTLRWHQSPSRRSTATVEDVNDKNDEINKIEDRLENWYAKVGEPLNSLDEADSISSNGPTSTFNLKEMKLARWKSLLPRIKEAHELYNIIDFINNRPPLFPKVSDFGKEEITTDPNCMTKFGYVFAKVLLPLSLEYALMSRDAEVRYLAKKVCQDLTSSNRQKYQDGIKAVTGDVDVMKTKFKQIVDREKSNLQCPTNGRSLKVENAIKEFNDVRFERIMALVNFLQNQGFAFGSALGSLDHEMNKDGAGFMHSMFLLRHRLRAHSSFPDLLKAMKWYTDFEEIYQPDNDYVYDGTTTDRMRTILLFRLMIILITPSEGNKENKIRDLNHFQTWFKHALKINKGLGGVIKPDFTGFHHKTFYGSAYVPHALHNAALVQYLIDGTSFALDQESKDHLRNALAVMRMVSVKYSTPNSICGRFPRYNRAVLAEQFPAYAYISYVHSEDDQPEGLDRPEMFLRLFDPNNPKVKGYLKNGAPRSWIYYWNTIGSLDVINKVATLKCKNDQTCQAEESPTGHWSKNFASLSIHRRGDWSVAARGFGKYTWDFEGSSKENNYGVFFSHGTLQISNSEDALKSYDVYNGWDWTRIPGATTVATNDMGLDQIKTKARNYNFQGFAGGVSFIGSSGGAKPKQGAFGMLFKTPKYVKIGKRSPLKNLEEFRKSYFFYDHLIVCLGSDIKVKKTNSDAIYAQTTLFQEKTVLSSIKMNGRTLPLTLDDDKMWTAETQVLEDKQGNTYQVKLDNGDNELHVKISNQRSKMSNGKTESEGKYATAWLKHTTSTSATKKSVTGTPVNNETSIEYEGMTSGDIYEDQDDIDDESDAHGIDLDSDTTTRTSGTLQPTKYEYAIIVKGGHKWLLSKYRVLQQDTNVHAVELNGMSSNTQDKVYGYSIFESLEQTPMISGPIKSADAPCMIMAEKRSKILKFSISNHDFEFEYDPKYKEKDTCTRQILKEIDEVFKPKASIDVGVKMMFCVQGKGSTINVKLNHDVEKITKVTVDGEEKNTDQITTYVEVIATNTKNVKFKNLINGFTTEVEFKLK
ncbi:hypothetical protein QZH41_000617 [Actinostola sp. cb2023]|nr:hypothetical protein QZH41_000617 [Actinostola sp. cb2023]